MPDSTTEHELAMTPRRQVILSAVRRSRVHPTADQVYESVRRKLPRISLGTVYRNLELMADRGLIHRLPPVHGRRRYDGTLFEHHHIRCIDCDAVADVRAPWDELPPLDSGRLAGYKVTGVHVEFTGFCRKCYGERILRQIRERRGEQQ